MKIYGRRNQNPNHGRIIIYMSNHTQISEINMLAPLTQII